MAKTRLTCGVCGREVGSLIVRADWGMCPRCVSDDQQMDNQLRALPPEDGAALPGLKIENKEGEPFCPCPPAGAGTGYGAGG